MKISTAFLVSFGLAIMLGGCQTASPAANSAAAPLSQPYAGVGAEMSDEAMARLTPEQREVALQERARARYPEMMARRDAATDRIVKHAISNCMTGKDLGELLALRNGNKCIFTAMAKDLNPAEQIEKFCVGVANFEAFEDCAIHGTLLYRMKTSLGEKSDPADWTAGRDAAKSYWDRITLGWVVDCVKPAGGTLHHCLTGKIAEVLQVDDSDLAYCRSRQTEIQIDCMVLAAALVMYRNAGESV
ncbi:MAG: hypothetical protein IPK59_05350 [Rhodospirillaceae bacterium]|nr:hypothetical protein [Rhodospirillaceae bacterium]